jgi:hypothetical protein
MDANQRGDPPALPGDSRSLAFPEVESSFPESVYLPALRMMCKQTVPKTSSSKMIFLASGFPEKYDPATSFVGQVSKKA